MVKNEFKRNCKFEDLTNKIIAFIKNNKNKKNVCEKRLNYSLNIKGEKDYNYRFPSSNKMIEEIKYLKIIEKFTGFKVYLNPERKNNGRAPDYWIEDIDELWDLKCLDGNGNDTIERALREAKNQTENIILKPRNSKFTIKEIKDKKRVLHFPRGMCAPFLSTIIS